MSTAAIAANDRIVAEQPTLEDKTSIIETLSESLLSSVATTAAISLAIFFLPPTSSLVNTCKIAASSLICSFIGQKVYLSQEDIEANYKKKLLLATAFLTASIGCLIFFQVPIGVSLAYSALTTVITNLFLKIFEKTANSVYKYFSDDNSLKITFHNFYNDNVFSLNNNFVKISLVVFQALVFPSLAASLATSLGISLTMAGIAIVGLLKTPPSVIRSEEQTLILQREGRIREIESSISSTRETMRHNESMIEDFRQEREPVISPLHPSQSLRTDPLPFDPNSLFKTREACMGMLGIYESELEDLNYEQRRSQLSRTQLLGNFDRVQMHQHALAVERQRELRRQSSELEMEIPVS